MDIYLSIGIVFAIIFFLMYLILYWGYNNRENLSKEDNKLSDEDWMVVEFIVKQEHSNVLMFLLGTMLLWLPMLLWFIYYQTNIYS